MKLLIRGGRVVDPASGRDALGDVFVADGKIAQAAGTPDRTIDAKGLVVAPGFIDLAARLREPGYEYRATLESEMDAAVAGGVTSLACPPDTDPPLDEPGLVDMLRRRAKALSRARVYPVGALTVKLAGKQLTEMAELAESGCVAFSQANVPVTDTQVLWRALQYAATFGLPVWLRAEDAWLAKDGVAHDGEVATRLGLAGIPVFAETIALAQLFELVRATGARVHICRISSAAGVAMLRRAKHDGLPLTCDVGIHHLHLSDMDLGYFDSSCRLEPPLRSQRDREALARGARRRHDRLHGIGSHAGGRGPEAAALRRGRAGRHRAGTSAAAGAQVGNGKETHARPDPRAHHQRSRAHPRRGLGAHRARRARGPGAVRPQRRLARDRRGAEEPGQEHALPRLGAHGARARHHRRRQRRPRGMRRIALLLVLVAGCSSTPEKRPGGYYKDDGPGDAARVAAVPDAVPRAEPLHRYANRPYEAMGRKYVPLTQVGVFKQRGTASWYGKRYHGNPTSSGEKYDMYKMSAAHPILPIPSYARVTNLANRRSVVVRVNDRGPFHASRAIDVSYAAAHKLGFIAQGNAQVEIEQIVPAGTPVARQ